MQTSKLKTYAPRARRDFIAAVSRRAAKFGLTAKGTSPVREEGQLAFIEGQPYPKAIGAQRQKLAARIQQQGFQQIMEAVAYTWFNRFAAIRFMELHGYLDHSYRVLSHPAGEGGLPEILDHAQHVDLPGLDRQRVVDLKMDGTRDEELYRDLLLAQCHALHQAMPFLFEPVDDATELLLPDNLLQTDSLIRELVTAIPEEDWKEIEIIGWLYQFYISEKKDQVIGKVVKSEDIPAATQLFTPNWIVKYMVQNSLGAQWLATYPDSPLKGQMEYYIEPAEQTDEVKAQLAAITPSALNPEELTLIDPACGSGHILVEAYELFKAIYLERGYRLRDIPRLILEKNLFGLDIDERAAQLTGFALMMKGRADDRRLFERGVKVNVMALVDSAGLDAEGLANGVELEEYGLRPGDLTELKRVFEHATTFGSLIQVPEGLAQKLPALKQLSEATSQDLFVSKALKRLGPLVWEAEALAAQYDAVVANPPYMGSSLMNAIVKKFVKNKFPESKRDLFACFIERGYSLAADAGHSSMVTMQSWMFLSSFEKMRERILRTKTIATMAHLGARAFGSISGEVVQATACVAQNVPLPGYKPAFFRLVDGGEQHKRVGLSDPKNRFDTTAQDQFRSIPGSALAYWIRPVELAVYRTQPPLSDFAEVRQGLTTTDDGRFLRLWGEVDYGRVGFRMPSRAAAVESAKKWFPFGKGGSFRKWHGNNSHIVNWGGDGADIHNHLNLPMDFSGAPVRSKQFYFRSGSSWSLISSSAPAFRKFEVGTIIGHKGPGVFSDGDREEETLGLLNSSVAKRFFALTSPTIGCEIGHVRMLPYSVPPLICDKNCLTAVHSLVAGHRADWNAYERSWDFLALPLLTASSDPDPTLEFRYTAWINKNRETIAEMKRLEEENNRLFIDAYGLQDELTPEVPIEQITLTVNPAYRYGWKGDREQGLGAIGEEGVRDEGAGARRDSAALTPDPYTLYPALESRFRQDTMQELVSYAIGCAMGRYRLDRPGLIYAHSGNERFWEIYEEGVRGEGLGASEEGVSDEHQELSRFDRLAEGNGSGGADLSGNAAVSQGGSLRPYQPNQTSGSIDSVEYRGGTRKAVESRVSELSVNRSRIPSGSGNTDPDRATIGLPDSGCCDGDPRTSGRDLAHAQHPDGQASRTPRPSPLIPNPFPPDLDGIIPITDTDWFDDDAAHRVVEFISVAWDKTHLEENLKFLADNLSPKKDESSRETIRRYLADKFFKDHLQTYKKRPIYWCFTSGKQKAFQCLVYLHRYNEGTLARMRMEYVVPLQSKMAARIDKLGDDIQAATTGAQAKRLQKERDKLTRQLEELRRFDEQLRHYADQRIALDLDDGVKVNYGKFGDLLAEVKAVTGKSPE